MFFMVKVELFSEGKNNMHNEDFFGNSSNSFVLVDGATDKSGMKYGGKTGGEIISRLVVKECLSSDLNGKALVEFLNKRVYELYEELGIEEKVIDAKYRFSCSFVCVRVIKDKIIITYLGDSGFRINGKEVYKETKEIDLYNSEVRAKYIAKTKDIKGSRAYLMPFLLRQFKYQNTLNKRFGYGVIDGFKTPAKYIKTFTYLKSNVKTIELFSDGYFIVPEEISITAWEQSYKYVEAIDPYKWKLYKSTKEKDDRTIAILYF